MGLPAGPLLAERLHRKEPEETSIPPATFLDAIPYPWGDYTCAHLEGLPP